MEALTVGLAIALFAVLAAEFVNGWTDAPNAIATVVSTGVMSPRNAVIMAVILNTLGAMAGTAETAGLFAGFDVGKPAQRKKLIAELERFQKANDGTFAGKQAAERLAALGKNGG